MSTVTRVIPPMPDASIPVVDPSTGLMTPAWRTFFFSLLAVLAEMRSLI